MTRADLLVAGGGPAGLAAAIAAARAGLSVVVVEPRDGAIDKPCGEGLMPSGAEALRALGVDDALGRPFVGVRYRDAEDADLVAEGAFPSAPGRGVRRIVLHDALRARAAALGVAWRRGRVDAVEQTADAVRAAGVEARWLVAADGLHSSVRRALGLDAPPRAAARFGVRRHYRVEPWTDRVEVHLASGAEAYVTPVAHDSVGVALLFEPPARFDELLARFPLLAARLRSAAPITPPRGAGPFAQRARRRVSGRVLLAGDAAGYVDALTGEGVALGMRTAMEAVRCIVDGDAAAYERRYAVLTRRLAWATRGLLALVTAPRLRRPFLSAARALPAAFDAALEVLGGAEPPDPASGLTTRSARTV